MKMCSNSGECFVILPPFTESNEVIYGRNSYRPEGEVSEVVLSTDKERSIIISKPFGINGAESGANDSSIAIGITWTDGESLIESYDSTTLTSPSATRLWLDFIFPEQSIDIYSSSVLMDFPTASTAAVFTRKYTQYKKTVIRSDQQFCIHSLWTIDNNPDDYVTYTLSYSKIPATVEIIPQKMALETSGSASDAVDKISDFIEKNHSCDKSDMPKYSFMICDNKEAWILNVAGKFWAAEVISEGYRHIPQGFSIKTKIDKCSPNLQQNVKDLSLWDGSGEFNFQQAFPTSIQQSVTNWPGNEPSADAKFSVINMFKTLRSVESDKPAQSSHVSQLSSNGVSCHWFTATPNPSESVFKPFVFTPNARISPLTVSDGTTTLLHKLYQQRDWTAVGNLLRSLEDACVEEMTRTLSEMGSIGNSEFDELLKDCVEAEVKFYR